MASDDAPTPDFSDLDFDVDRHREALAKLPLLNPDPRSVKPILRARETVMFRRPSGAFSIVIASPAGAVLPGSHIHDAPTPEEALIVRADVERYFQRHFPGRTRVHDADPGACTAPCHVFVAFLTE
jgi:hypothetical protein